MIRKALELTALVLIVGGVTFGAYSHADAQYPEPEGSVVIDVDDATAGAGQDVLVTATALDTSGNAVAGASCTFRIAQQPGADASVEAGPFTTNADGQVTTTLHTGSTAGPVVIEGSCVRPDCPGDGSGATAGLTAGPGGCTLSANATVSVGAAEGPASPAAPPASLPDTGAGPGDGGNGWLAWAFLAAGASMVLTALAVRLRPRRLSR